MSTLTTHILDTSLGKPAAQVHFSLYQIEGASHQLLNRLVTNTDGRTATPLLTGESFKKGVYELIFSMAPYFKAHYNNLPDPLFFQDIPIRFAIADPKAHYHVPLLVSPFGFIDPARITLYAA